jgi:hypothetical protein
MIDQRNQFVQPVKTVLYPHYLLIDPDEISCKMQEQISNSYDQDGRSNQDKRLSKKSING